MKVSIEFEVPSATGVNYDPKALDAWLAQVTQPIRGNRFVENYSLNVRFE